MVQSNTEVAEAPIDHPSTENDANEKIVAAALKIGSMIISAPPPARHHTLLHAFHAYNRKTMISPSDQGFVTSEGRFVGRKEAALLAVAAGQIIKPAFQPEALFSEDLW